MKVTVAVYLGSENWKKKSFFSDNQNQLNLHSSSLILLRRSRVKTHKEKGYDNCLNKTR